MLGLASQGWKFHRARARSQGLTVVELAVALGILGVLLAIAVPAFQDYRTRIRNNQAREDIAIIAAAVDRYQQDSRAYPSTLAEAGVGTPQDPWGRPYQYLSMSVPGARGHARKDHSLVPINTDFDLYSMGPDGRSAPPLTAQMSRDDFVRANNGAFVGPASEY